MVKVIPIIINITALTIILLFVEGDLKKWGIIGFILFNIIIAAWRMYQNKEALKQMLGYAHSLGKKHGGNNK